MKFTRKTLKYMGTDSFKSTGRIIEELYQIANDFTVPIVDAANLRKKIDRLTDEGENTLTESQKNLISEMRDIIDDEILSPLTQVYNGMGEILNKLDLLKKN